MTIYLSGPIDRETTMARTLRYLAPAMGVSCVLIGLFHIALGIPSVPGEEFTNATVDSRERFYNAIFAGYVLAWIWAARQSPVPAGAVRFLAGIVALAAIGRLLSMADVGRPHGFQTALTALEVVLPVVFFWLAAADEKAHGSTSVPALRR